MSDPAPIEPEVRRSVRALLERAPAYRQLGPDERRRLADGMAAVGATLAADAHEGRSRKGGKGGVAGEVDLPAFVAGLIEGTFQAVVDASIQQLQAYADLLETLAEADVPIIHDRMGDKLAPAHVRPAGGRIKWPP